MRGRSLGKLRVGRKAGVEGWDESYPLRAGLSEGKEEVGPLPDTKLTVLG